jgi:plasmid stabilization system protein ParE
MRYSLTPLAEGDIREILQYLRQQDPRTAKRLAT